MNRISFALIPILFAAVVVGTGVLWFAGDTSETALPQSAPAQTAVEIGGPFSLIDQNGERRTDADFRGRFMLVFFGYTYCPDVCPTTLAILSAALDRLGPLSSRIVPILISVDPARDTPEVLKPYLSAFGDEFVGLTGTADEVAAAAGAYKVYYHANAESETNYTVDHTALIYLMGPDGGYLANYSLEDGPDTIADDLKEKLDAL